MVLIICVAGMPGAGKSIVAQAARDMGIPVVTMGDVVREETLKRYGVITPSLMRETSRLVREEYGEEYVAVRTAEKIRGLGAPAVLVDGVRSLVEVDVFRRYGETVIVAIHASQKTRFERIRRRGRPGDPDNWEDFVKRDMVELGFGLGNVIALADYMIVNEGTIEEAYEWSRRVLCEIRGGGCEDKG